MSSLVSLGVSSVASILTGFYTQSFWSFISLRWNPGLQGLSHSLVVPPSLSACKCGTAPSASHHLAQSTSCHLAKYPFGPSMLVQMVSLHSFLWPSNIPLCKCTTAFLSTYLLMGIWAASKRACPKKCQLFIAALFSTPIPFDKESLFLACCQTNFTL